jgi:AAA domain
VTDTEPRDLLAGLRGGKYLRETSFPALEYHLPGIIPEGATLLVGPPKIGKSWMLLSLALGVASGGRVLGLSVEERPVLYLALEDSHRRLQVRCEKLLGTTDDIPDAFGYLTRIEPASILETVNLALDRLDRVSDAGPAPLVILDTLGKVMPPTIPGESPYQRDYRVGSALKHLVDDRPGAALVIAHHDRKANADDFVDAVSGTHGLAGAVDTVIVLARARQEHGGLLKVTGRDVEENEYAVTLKAGSTWELAGQSLQAAVAQAMQVRATKGVGDRMAEIISYVTACPHPVGVQDVAQALDLDADPAGRYLRRAVEAGRLERIGRGSYTPVRSVRLSGTGNGHSDTTDTPLACAREASEQLDLLTDAFGNGIEEVR